MTMNNDLKNYSKVEAKNFNIFLLEKLLKKKIGIKIKNIEN